MILFIVSVIKVSEREEKELDQPLKGGDGTGHDTGTYRDNDFNLPSEIIINDPRSYLKPS